MISILRKPITTNECEMNLPKLLLMLCQKTKFQLLDLRDPKYFLPLSNLGIFLPIPWAHIPKYNIGLLWANPTMAKDGTMSKRPRKTMTFSLPGGILLTYPP